jgi:hypothetical protein
MEKTECKEEIDLNNERLELMFQENSYPHKFCITRFKAVEKGKNM